jgi:hypothetical protein
MNDGELVVEFCSEVLLYTIPLIFDLQEKGRTYRALLNARIVSRNLYRKMTLWKIFPGEVVYEFSRTKKWIVRIPVEKFYYPKFQLKDLVRVGMGFEEVNFIFRTHDHVLDGKQRKWALGLERWSIWDRGKVVRDTHGTYKKAKRVGSSDDDRSRSHTVYSRGKIVRFGERKFCGMSYKHSCRHTEKFHNVTHKKPRVKTTKTKSFKRSLMEK